MPAQPEGQSRCRGHQDLRADLPDRVHRTQVGGWKSKALAGLPESYDQR